MDSRPKLLSSAEYVADCTKAVRSARRRISLLTMIVVYDESTAIFFDALMEASKRGVEITATADSFSYSELGGHFRLHSQFSRSIKPITELKKRLKQAGIKLNWLGNQATSIVSGRTHIKWCVVDDTVYAFGGVNLYAEGIRATDYMFRVRDAFLADKLCAEHRHILAANQANRPYRSHMYGDDKRQVLIDGGFVGDSIIYRRACKLAREATSIVYVSQYCPTGKLAHIIKKKDATLYYNPSNTAKSLNALAIRIGTVLTGLTTNYKRPNYLHCKCMLFTLPDGSKRAITGSHNFSAAGVWLGTREVALETSDPHIIEQLERFITKNIA